MTAKLRGIEGTKKELDKINKKIHEYMIKTIPNYKAKQWSEVIQHRLIASKYVLIMVEDKRNPNEILTKNEKKLIDDNITARDYIIQFDELDQ